jgi:hypothetical protein
MKNGLSQTGISWMTVDTVLAGKVNCTNAPDEAGGIGLGAATQFTGTPPADMVLS